MERTFTTTIGAAVSPWCSATAGRSLDSTRVDTIERSEATASGDAAFAALERINSTRGRYSEAFEDQSFYLARNGFRCISHDRRGHGRSSQPFHGNDMETYADDLAELVTKLELTDAIDLGHSTGGGEVVRYLGKYGTKRAKKAVLIGAVPPLMLKTPANPGGSPLEAFDGIRAAVLKDRS